MVERIAKDLGRFLAEFVIATSDPNIDLLSLFPSSSGLMNQFDIYLINNLRTVFLSHGVPDAEILIKRVEDAMKDYWNFELCLGMVDLWRNNIFIDSDKNICLIDWEYFGLSNASHEMSLLGRFFYLFSGCHFLIFYVRTVQSLHWILLKSSTSDAAMKSATTFISIMLRNYGQVRADVPSPRFRRHALITHGRETISLLKWLADQFDDDSMRQRALESGLVYLRAAGESVDTMDVSIFDSETMTPYESLFEKAREILTAR